MSYIEKIRCVKWRFRSFVQYMFDEGSLVLELAIEPLPSRGNFVHYDFLKLHYIRHKIKDVSPLRVAALT